MSTTVLTATSSVKMLLNITSTTKDDMITAMIPKVIDDINYYTNNWFLQSTRYIYTNDINFSTGSSIAAGLMTLETTGWTFTEDFRAGDTIYISGTKFNDGYYTCATVGSSSIVTNEIMITEASTSGKLPLINRVDFPRDLELIASQMVGYKVNQEYQGKASESIGDYSISYITLGTANYPPNILNSLNKYKLIRMF